VTTSSSSDVLVSVVAPTWDSESYIASFCRDLSDVLEEGFVDYEIIIIINGATDNTADELATLQRELRNLRVMTLARPISHDAVLMAGVEHAIGDVVVTVDPRFDPVGSVAGMLGVLQRKNVDIVYGVRRDRSITGAQTFYDRFARAFYGLLGRWAGIDIPRSVGTLQMFSRRAVNAFLDHTDRYDLFRAMGAFTGLPYAEYQYERVARSGESRNQAGLRSAIGVGAYSLLLSSRQPLRILTMMSVAGAGVNLLYSAFIVIINLVKEDVTDGWTSLSLQITGLFFILFLVVGVLSEYVLRIFMAQQNQLPYIITRETSSFEHLRKRDLNVVQGNLERRTEDG